MVVFRDIWRRAVELCTYRLLRFHNNFLSSRCSSYLRYRVAKEFQMVILKGWKYGAFIGTIVGAIGIAIYPIIISPMIDPEPYRRVQTTNRMGIKQDEIQPGNMKVWSDPFGRPKNKDP